MAMGTSLVVQRVRIHLPMQGTQGPSLVQEDSTCCGATQSMLQSPRAETTEACAPRTCAPQEEESLQEDQALQLEKACISIGDPATNN